MYLNEIFERLFTKLLHPHNTQNFILITFLHSF